MMSEVLIRMRDNLMNLEYEDLADTDSDEMYEYVVTDALMLTEISSEDNATREYENNPAKTHQNEKIEL